MNKIILMRIAERAINALPNEHEANDIMQAEDFREYIAENGYHFNDKLADYVTLNQLGIKDTARHNWTTEQVKSALGSQNLPCCHTWGDASYAANHIYATSYPLPYKTEAEVLEAAKRSVKDPDKYEGYYFMHWLSDMIGRKQNLVWSDYL